ncbi:hypothetical protein ACI2UY_22245 [Ralstonia nicotianae]
MNLALAPRRWPAASKKWANDMSNGNLTYSDWFKSKKLLDAVTEKASIDEEFRRALIANPVEVFAREGLYFADGREVVVHQNSDATYHFVLPCIPVPSGGAVQGFAEMQTDPGSSSLDRGGPRCTKP